MAHTGNIYQSSSIDYHIPAIKCSNNMKSPNWVVFLKITAQTKCEISPVCCEWEAFDWRIFANINAILSLRSTNRASYRLCMLIKIYIWTIMEISLVVQNTLKGKVECTCIGNPLKAELNGRSLCFQPWKIYRTMTNISHFTILCSHKTPRLARIFKYWPNIQYYRQYRRFQRAEWKRTVVIILINYRNHYESFWFY